MSRATGRPWRMSVYDLALGGRPVTVAGAAHRFVYVLSGLVRARTEDGSTSAEAGGGLFATGGAELDGVAAAWVFEVDPTASPPLPRDGLSLVLSAPFALPDEPHLIRADRVEAPPGAVTPRHRHRGPGIRRLLHGGILGELGDHFQRIESGQAWFETGHDPIVGHAIDAGHSAFVRVMILPIELAGGASSFVPTSSDEAEKPRRTIGHILGEIPCGVSAPGWN